MNRQQAGLALSLNAAGVPLSVSTFDDRLVLQKAVYLLQLAGVHFGYRYRWYLRGPYSSEVASDAFAIAGDPEASSELQRWSLDADSVAAIQRMAPVFVPQRGMPLSLWLELLASVAFLVKTNQSADANSLVGILHANGKNFDLPSVQDALVTLHEYGLVA